MTRRSQGHAVCVLLALGAALLGGCLERDLKALNPCLVSGVVAKIAVTNIDKIDLLFMVDNSNSMREEQDALREQFPNLIRVLTSGDINPNDDVLSNFPPVTDMHLAVVSSDLGLPGIHGVMGCSGLGSDGKMIEVGACAPSSPFPRFLEFSPSQGEDAVALGAQLASEFGCVANLGTGGCGLEQQLENTLKAVWPADRSDLWFLPDPTGFGGIGQHGPLGANGDFIRNDPNDGLSLIAIVLVTDEEDCSSGNMSHFLPEAQLDPADPLRMQGLNTRCFFESKLDRDPVLDGIQNNLYGPGRYVQALRALRPGKENLVIFAAIVGVPPDLVDESDLNAVKFDDPAQVNAFYDGILADSSMIESVNDQGTPSVHDDNLNPSCNRGEDAKAYPPRRILEVARGFGENGIVQSICQDDFTPAINQIIKLIAKQLGAVCLPRPLVRNSDGLVGCNVVWELPAPNDMAAPNTTPRQCSDKPFLITPDMDRDHVSDSGGAVCTVAQLRLVDAPEGEDEEKMPDPMGTANFNPATMAEQTYMEGWYYDDFSTSVKADCPGEEKQRVAFSNNAKPPTGVTVKLECLNETQSLADSRTNLEDQMQPNIGTSCEEGGNDACLVRLRSGEIDDTMFCHLALNVCVLGCVGDSDCPASWVCDKRAETTDVSISGGGPYCVNPTCGGGEGR
jgi:hypothetical protein